VRWFIKAPVLAFYGEDDARVTGAAEPTKAAMEKLGKEEFIGSRAQDLTDLMAGEVDW
jgi:hypothetical protein